MSLVQLGELHEMKIVFILFMGRYLAACAQPKWSNQVGSLDFRWSVYSSSLSHYREVPWWEIFMEQKLRFGLDLGRMADFPAFIALKSFDL